jgi:deoxyribodipyrimidine photolyase-related protein
MTQLFLVLGDQLFAHAQHHKGYENATFYLAEDEELCTRYRMHTHKIVFFLGAMRQYADELHVAKRTVVYKRLDDEAHVGTYEEKLLATIKERNITELIHFEIEDHFLRERIDELCKQQNIKHTVHESPMFLTSTAQFQEYLASVKKPFLKTFYERQRKRLNILVDEHGKPLGGQWSYDEDNRKPLPSDAYIEPLPQIIHADRVNDVIDLVGKRFPLHPGAPDEFWLPSNRAQALAWLDDFLTHRLQDFGAYEDALSTQHAFLNHSVLSPLLNAGLLTPHEVVERVLTFGAQSEAPLPSIEGFIRQIIGWREFVRGIYHAFPQEGEQNFWQHERTLAPTWYTGETGIVPLDHVIRKVMRRGYAHHIERLMLLSNVMLLCEIHPKHVHRWFSEVFIDSADWVMGPNVYGMGQMSDGGLFATKPYI